MAMQKGQPTARFPVLVMTTAKDIHLEPPGSRWDDLTPEEMSNKKGGVAPPFGYIFVYYLFLQAPGPPVGGTSHLHAESASQDR